MGKQVKKHGYSCKLVRVVDGDTADAMIDLGFNTWVKKRIRFMGVDAWESRTRNLEEKKKGLAAKAYVKDLLEKSWQDVQDNLGKFQTLFRSNFKIVDNSKFLTAKAAQSKFKTIMGQGIDKFVKKPVKNPIGKTWIKNQKKLVKNKKRFS